MTHSHEIENDNIDLTISFPDRFMVDAFEPKTGPEKDIIVFTFPVNNKKAAIRLGLYIKQGDFDLMDVEVSPSTENRALYLIFVEMRRTKKIFDVMSSFLKFIESLTGKKEWYFKAYEFDQYLQWKKTIFLKTVFPESETNLVRNRINQNVEITKLRAQEVNHGHAQNIKLKNCITENHLHLESLQKEIDDLNSIKKNLSHHYKNMKVVRKQLNKQLELFKQHEELSLLRAEQDYMRIRELESRISQIYQPGSKNTHAFVQPSNTPDISTEADS